ncbi:VasL domain-containing protein [Photorhabdus luminescens]|uniref:VasL domain-containing protein n=1 Tax=Photorhabdus luminescens TaxID=29488 RepID=UPI003211A952
MYQIQHSHNHDIPLEELLRQLADTVEQGQAVSPALIKKTDDRFNALLSRYYALQQAAGLTARPEQHRP